MDLVTVKCAYRHFERSEKSIQPLEKIVVAALARDDMGKYHLARRDEHLIVAQQFTTERKVLPDLLAGTFSSG